MTFWRKVAVRLRMLAPFPSQRWIRRRFHPCRHTMSRTPDGRRRDARQQRRHVVSGMMATLARCAPKRKMCRPEHCAPAVQAHQYVVLWRILRANAMAWLYGIRRWRALPCPRVAETVAEAVAEEGGTTQPCPSTQRLRRVRPRLSSQQVLLAQHRRRCRRPQAVCCQLRQSRSPWT